MHIYKHTFITPINAHLYIEHAYIYVYVYSYIYILVLNTLFGVTQRQLH